MKKLSLFFIFYFSILISYAQSVGIGTTTPNSNAMLEIRSNSKGVLMPRLSTASKNAMANVPKGMMVYDSTVSAFYYHDGSKWRLFSETNTDSLTTNYLNTPQETINISPAADNQYTFLQSGILYDNGGPAANYGNNRYDVYGVLPDDSTVGFRVMLEQINISAGDTLFIYISNDETHKISLTGNTPGSYYFAATGALVFIFKSNAAANAAGFTIRWSKVDAINSTAPPAFGWYYDAKKTAVRGGLNINNSWISDSLGRYSFAWGINALATGMNSFSAGNNTKASGSGSLAIGSNNEASGPYSVALGREGKASGFNSFTMGDDNSAGSSNAAAIGSKNTASGYSSVAMGNYTEASGYNSTAIGSYTEASGDNAIAIGTSTRATAYRSIVIGANNTNSLGYSATSWVPSDPIFIIGNGRLSGSNSNAMMVLKNGRIGIGANAPKTQLHIDAGLDASLVDTSGYFVIGDVNSGNLVFDNNEIIARDNGANNTLYLQNTGGPLQTGGTAAKPGGGSWAATSDARLKQNVQPYNDGLQQLLKINPVVYQYNKLSGYDTEKKYVGVLAQEIKQVVPYMVGTFKKENNEYYNVDNSAMVYMLINAVKEQQQQIEELKSKVEQLQKK
ncbi:MAG: tail fiber domain-containing protein [Bacteroidota bacterium]